MKVVLHSGLYLIALLNKSTQSMLSIIRILLVSRPVKPLPAPTNKKCSLLGNGPSLNISVEQHLDFLKETELVCVNTFAASDYYELLQPTNYVLIDPAFFSEADRSREVISSTFKAMVEKTSWPMHLYVPRTSKKSVLLQDLLARKKNISAVYFNYTIFEGFTSLKFWAFRSRLAMPQAQNVMVASMFLMINRKFETIFLFGADHSWHEEITLNTNNEAVYRDLHFYDKKELDYEVVDEIHKGKVTISQQFASLVKAFYGYEVLKSYAEALHVTVINASHRSYIDAFKKVRIVKNNSDENS